MPRVGLFIAEHVDPVRHGPVGRFQGPGPGYQADHPIWCGPDSRLLCRRARGILYSSPPGHIPHVCRLDRAAHQCLQLPGQHGRGHHRHRRHCKQYSPGQCRAERPDPDQWSGPRVYWHTSGVSPIQLPPCHNLYGGCRLSGHWVPGGGLELAHHLLPAIPDRPLVPCTRPAAGPGRTTVRLYQCDEPPSIPGQEPIRRRYATLLP